jgi:hypothetical protein
MDHGKGNNTNLTTVQINITVKSNLENHPYALFDPTHLFTPSVNVKEFVVIFLDFRKRIILHDRANEMMRNLTKCGDKSFLPVYLPFPTWHP